jgi:negative regulator of sigma E activity
MCSIMELEKLEALVAGELDEPEATRVLAHAERCDECKAELAWLRAEAELMTRRRQTAQAPGPAMWEGINERLANPPMAAAEPVQRWGWGARIAYGGLIVAAAAAVVLVTMPGVKLFNRELRDSSTALMHTTAMAPRKKVAPEVTFDRAEAEYRDAAAVLEAEYKQERSRLPAPVAEQYDRMLKKTRTQVADARQAAGSDVDGRMVVLDGYAEYLRSLQTIVTDIR